MRAVHSEFGFLGDVTKVEEIESGLLLYCGKDKVKALVLSDQIIRIRLGRGGRFKSEHSYAVVKTDWPQIGWRWNEAGNQITIQTEALSVRINKRPCRLSFYDLEGRLINEDEPAFGMGWSGDEVTCWKKLRPEEKFYGLGEKTGDLNKRGHQYTMWNYDPPLYTPVQDPFHQSHPFFIGVIGKDAYGIFLDNTYRTNFNMGASNSRFYFFSAEGGELDYYFIYGPGIKQVIQRYKDIVGRMPLPPKWATGYQQSRWNYYSEGEVRRIADTFREKSIPCDVIYLDISHMDGYRVFTWDKSKFPDPAAMISDLEKQGFKIVLIVNPGVKIDPEFEVYQSGIEGNHFIRYPDGELYQGEVWPGWVHFPDFTRPATREWWGNWFKESVEIGAKGFWLDMNEPTVWGLSLPNLVQFDDEGHRASHKKVHNVYGSLMAQATYEGVQKLAPNRRVFILTRAGFSGVQKYGWVWTGDNEASFEDLRMGVTMCLGLGLSGVSYIGDDVGGFMGNPTAELFARWIQLGAFTPLFRDNTATNTPSQEAWSFGENVEEISRKYIALRYRLIPYVYNVFYESSKMGIPIMRPIFLEFPDDPRAYDLDVQYQFFFGRDLLIAPVLWEGRDLRKLYLPQGEWIDFWSDQVYEGSRNIIVEAPLDHLPIFVRAGAIIPMQQEQQYIGERPVEELIWQVYPAKQFQTEYYEDDGETMAYQDGNYSLQIIQGEKINRGLRLNWGERQGNFQTTVLRNRVQLHLVEKKPSSISWKGMVLKESKMVSQLTELGTWFYDAEAKRAIVLIPNEVGELVVKW
jgi:alpha-glucosidase